MTTDFDDSSPLGVILIEAGVVFLNWQGVGDKDENREEQLGGQLIDWQ